MSAVVDPDVHTLDMTTHGVQYQSFDIMENIRGRMTSIDDVRELV